MGDVRRTPGLEQNDPGPSFVLGFVESGICKPDERARLVAKSGEASRGTDADRDSAGVRAGEAKFFDRRQNPLGDD